MTHDPFAPIGWPKRIKTRLRRWGAGCLRPLRRSRIRSDRTGPANLLILAVDTLRYDHLGLSGYARPTSPALDELAAGGTVFDDVTAPAPWTLPSFASSLTGLMPCLHGAGMSGALRNMDRQPPCKLSEGVVNLARHLQRLGYRTAAFYSNPFLGFGLAESFEFKRYDNVPAADLAFQATEWVRRHADRPFFCFVLFNDPHEPTTPPQSHLHPFLDELRAEGNDPHGRQLRALARWGDPKSGGVNLGRQHEPLDDEARRALAVKLALYDAAIAYVDATIDRMASQLAAWQLDRNTLLTIYSDHGEEFLDHLDVAQRWDRDPRQVRAVGHGHTHFQELLHVPWLAVGPGVPADVRIRRPVSLCDVAPTLLDWLALPPLPLPPIDQDVLVGRSVTSLASMEAAEDGQGVDSPEPGSAAGTGRTVLAEDLAYGPDLVAVRRGRWKLIGTRQGEPWALYDLVADPGEKTDRRDSEPELVRELGQAIVALRETKPVPPDASPPGDGWRDVSDTVRKRLQELGYAE